MKYFENKVCLAVVVIERKYESQVKHPSERSTMMCSKVKLNSKSSSFGLSNNRVFGPFFLQYTDECVKRFNDTIRSGYFCGK